MEDPPRIKVTDRRMFTPDGQLRDDAEAPGDDADQPAPEPERPPVAATRASGEPATREALSGVSPAAPGREEAPFLGPSPGGLSFLDLVGLLAEPIALYLGDLPMPNGERALDLDQARVYIDLLGILEEKTRGNLSREEEAVLSDLVYRLKMRYVQKRESA
jgi:hypothetical protein